MSLKKTTSNELIKDLIGYDPENYGQKILEELNKDGQKEKSHRNQNNDEPIKYRRQNSNTFIT